MVEHPIQSLSFRVIVDDIQDLQATAEEWSSIRFNICPCERGALAFLAWLDLGDRVIVDDIQDLQATAEEWSSI